MTFLYESRHLPLKGEVEISVDDQDPSLLVLGLINTFGEAWCNLTREAALGLGTALVKWSEEVDA